MILLLNSCLTQGQVDGWDVMKPLYRMPADNACRTITGADEMKWNEMIEISVEKWWNDICGKGKREKRWEKPA